MDSLQFQYSVFGLLLWKTHSFRFSVLLKHMLHFALVIILYILLCKLCYIYIYKYIIQVKSQQSADRWAGR